MDPVVGVTELFEREYDAMLRLAYLLIRDQHDAEEVVQDAFLDVQERWDRLLNPGGYLRMAVVNGAKRGAERERNRRRIVRRDATKIAPTDDRAEYEPIVDVLLVLPERQRTAVVLAYYLALGPREIAEALDCRVGTAKSLVHRGLRRLKKELSE